MNAAPEGLDLAQVSRAVLQWIQITPRMLSVTTGRLAARLLTALVNQASAGSVT